MKPRVEVTVGDDVVRDWRELASVVDHASLVLLSSLRDLHVDVVVSARTFCTPLVCRKLHGKVGLHGEDVWVSATGGGATVGYGTDDEVSSVNRHDVPGARVPVLLFSVKLPPVTSSVLIVMSVHVVADTV